MENAFSPKNKLLIFSTLDQEQVGMMQIYRGVMAFFRNSAGHLMLLGANFDLSLIDVINDRNEDIIKTISQPQSRVSIEMNKTIESGHGLAYIKCFDDKRFMILVVYREITPRRMVPSGPLGLLD